MFFHKPVIAEYDICTENDMTSKDLGFNLVHADNGKMYSFRCPNKKCGKPVKIGYPVCPFCSTRLKWKYPFDMIRIN